MSLPSIAEITSAKGLSLDTATEDQLRLVAVESVQKDLHLGYANIERMVEELRQGARRVKCTLDPNSEAGKQFIRIFASDTIRKSLEHYFNIQLGFYNCCTGVMVRKNGALEMTLREQIVLQSPDSLDC